MSLTFTLKNHERRSDKIIRHTIGLIRSVLESLNYNGTWGVTFLSQQTNRTDKRWQPMRVDGYAVIVKTKPQGNDSCWEMILIPPKEYNVHKVFEKFLTIHPVRLTAPSTSLPETIKLFGQTIPRPQLADLKVSQADLITRNVEKTIEAFELIVEEPTDKIPESKLPEAPKPIEKKLEPKPNLLDLKPSQHWKDGKPLAIDPLWFPITDHRIIMNALIAAATVLDMHTGHCTRKLVVATIERELNLAHWLNRNRRNPLQKDKKGYTSILGLTREILNILVDNKYLSRYGYLAQTPPIRMRTSGYMVTVEGRKKIEAWKKYIPDEIAARLYSGDYGRPASLGEVFEDDDEENFIDDEPTPIVQNNPQPVQTVAVQTEEDRPADKNQTINLIASRLGELTPLVDQHDKLIAEIKEYDELVEPTKNNLESAGFIVEGIKAKLAPVQKELERLQFQLAEAEKKYSKAQADLDYVFAEKQQAEEKLDGIKHKLKTMLG